MNDAEFWRLVAEFLAAQQSIPGDPSAAVGGDPSGGWMDQYAYGQGAIGSYDPAADFDPMADTTIASANQYGSGIDTSPSSWGQNAPTNVPMRTMYGLQGGLVARQNGMQDQNNAALGYDRLPMLNDLQYGLQQHQMQQHPLQDRPRIQPVHPLQSQPRVQPVYPLMERPAHGSSPPPQRPVPVAAPTAEPVERRVAPRAQQVVRALTQRPAPAPVPMARPMPNAVRRSR